MQDNPFHMGISVLFFGFNVICLGLLAISCIFFSNHIFVGLVLAFTAVSLTLIGTLWYLKCSRKFINSFSGMPIIVEQILTKSSQPITIFKRSIGKFNSSHLQLVFANNAYLKLKKVKLKDIIGLDVTELSDISEYDQKRIRTALINGFPTTARLVDKDSHGRFFESELNISPVHITDKVTYWIGYRNDMQMMNNIIDLDIQVDLSISSKLD